jgi:predicted dehydrogenase
MGGAHLNHFVNEGAQPERNSQVVAVCDVYRPRLESAQNFVKSNAAKGGSETPQADKDYRRLLENKDIDAIVIATPEHWHAQIACHAMEAGKHVYIQKPMTRYLDEAFQVHDTAVRTKRVVQVGSQGCSDYRFHTAGQAVREGRIGNVVLGQSSYTRHNPRGEWNYGIPGDLSPDTLDWKLWLGSAPDRPFNTTGGAGGDEQPMRDDAGARFARYRKYRDYSAGILGDLMPHRLHPFVIASGKPEYPTRVMALGTQLTKDREVEDQVQVMAEFPSGWTMLFIGSTVNEQGLPDMIRGSKGTVYFGQGVEIRPERTYAEEIEAGSIPINGPTGEPHQRHENDWLNAIRTGKKPNCDIDLATKVQTVISLAELSMVTSKAVVFDEKTRKVTMG